MSSAVFYIILVFIYSFFVSFIIPYEAGNVVSKSDNTYSKLNENILIL